MTTVTPVPKVRLWRPLLSCFALLCLLGPAPAEEAPTGVWTELPRPDVGKGLMMEPRLLSVGPRVHLVWSGTNSEIRSPEVFHTSLAGDETAWTNPRAPFFGMNRGRVRKLGIGKSRDQIALVFQRTMRQGNDAYEIRFSLSNDRGWSWSKPMEIDSFVAEKSGGTWVAVEGLQGSRRPEFAMAWSRDFGTVRVANIDVSSSLRPQGVKVGEHVPGAMKADVAALGRDGFTVVFNNGAGLAKSHMKALNGESEDAHIFLQGRFGNFFTMASRPYGPARLAVGSGTTVEAFTSSGEALKKDDETTTLPFSASGMQAESDMDEDKDLHLALLEETPAGAKLWYLGQRDRKWGEPELITTFEKDFEIRGFDIAVTDDYIYTAISQGYEARFYRRKLD